MSMINAYSADGAGNLPQSDRELIARRERVLGPAYRLFYETPVHVVRADGVWLYGPEGEAYLDCYNNVAGVGHCHPGVIAAMIAQATVLNTHTRYLNEGVIDYAERLTSMFPPALSQAMFTCTGSEANDLALRIARAHTGGTGMIVTREAYHGVTLAVAQMSPSLGRFVTLGDHVRTIPAPDVREGADVGARFANSVREAVADMAAHGIKPAALLVDTLFSSDGVFSDPAGFLEPAAAAIRQAGGLLIADEVQAGFGRTGEGMWGFSRHGLTPDIVTMGKPMGAGHPLAGLVAKPEVIETFGRTSRYFNTFGGNPVSCAIGMAVLDVIRDEGLIENSARVGAYLRERLTALPEGRDRLGQLRGVGLFIGADIVGASGAPDAAAAARLVNGLRERRVLISATGPNANVLKIRPPLVFSRENADTFVDALAAALAQL